MIQHFSDINNDAREVMPIDVWNGIVALYNELIANNKLAEKFPLNCQDGQGVC